MPWNRSGPWPFYLWESSRSASDVSTGCQPHLPSGSVVYVPSVGTGAPKSSIIHEYGFAETYRMVSKVCLEEVAGVLAEDLPWMVSNDTVGRCSYFICTAGKLVSDSSIYHPLCKAMPDESLGVDNNNNNNIQEENRVHARHHHCHRMASKTKPDAGIRSC
jgi:hypothetical protein